MNLEQRIETFGAEKIFIAVFIVFGVMILFMRPPYQLMDEINHLPRAWQISEGVFLSPTTTIGDFVNGSDYRSKKIFNLDEAPPNAWRDNIYVAEIPVSFLPNIFIADAKEKHFVHAFALEDIKNFLAAPLNANAREPAIIPQTGVYPPPTYLPQAVAAFIGRALNLNAGIIFYLMGLSGLIFVAACVWWSMKFLPEAKPLIFLLAMMPMFIVEAASTSADAVTFGVCLLGSAWLLSLRQSTARLSRGELVGLIVLSIMLACCKSVYGTILLLYFLMPRERVGSLKKFLSFGAVILLLNLFVSLIWSELSVAIPNVPLYTSYYHGDLLANMTAQKIFITEHPAAFFTAMINSLLHFKLWYVMSFIGTWSPQCNVNLPMMFHLLYSMAIIFFALSNGLSFRLDERALLIFAAAVSTIGFFLVHYLKWSAVGGELVGGIQGRYFIPIALMMFCALSVFPPMRHKNLIALAAGVFSGVVMLWTNYLAFY